MGQDPITDTIEDVLTAFTSKQKEQEESSSEAVELIQRLKDETISLRDYNRIYNRSRQMEMTTLARLWAESVIDNHYQRSHKTTIRLLRTQEGTPYKWKSECVCGWNSLSWQWVRTNEETGQPDPERGGVLPLSLEHLQKQVLTPQVRRRMIADLSFLAEKYSGLRQFVGSVINNQEGMSCSMDKAGNIINKYLDEKLNCTQYVPTCSWNTVVPETHAIWMDVIEDYLLLSTGYANEFHNSYQNLISAYDGARR